LEALLSAEVDSVAATLNERASNGFVRRCHGDLHLANIIVWDGRPALYDAIEFDAAVASIDTLYDLAFLLMDLDWHNQWPAANLVLNRYLWRSGEPLDLPGLSALPLFLTLRAAVRAMVTTDRASLKACEARESDLTVARGYLRAALDYLQARPPRLIAIAGWSGTGKTTVAANLACGLGRAPGLCIYALIWNASGWPVSTSSNGYPRVPIRRSRAPASTRRCATGRAGC
jgi:uncharacterized protein